MRQRHTRLLAHKDTHSKSAVKHTHALSPSLYLMFVPTLAHSQGWPSALGAAVSLLKEQEEASWVENGWKGRGKRMDCAHLH